MMIGIFVTLHIYGLKDSYLFSFTFMIPFRFFHIPVLVEASVMRAASKKRPDSVRSRAVVLIRRTRLLRSVSP